VNRRAAKQAGELHLTDFILPTREEA